MRAMGLYIRTGHRETDSAPYKLVCSSCTRFTEQHESIEPSYILLAMLRCVTNKVDEWAGRSAATNKNLFPICLQAVVLMSVWAV